MEERTGWIFLLIITYGVIQNLIFSISILSRLRDKKDLKKALAFLFCIIASIFFLLPPIFYSYNTPIPVMICAPFIASIGPLYYISMKTVIRGDNELFRTDVLQMIPSALLVICVPIVFILGITDIDIIKKSASLSLVFATFHTTGYFVATVIFLAGQIPGKIAGYMVDQKIKKRLVLNVLYAVCFILAGVGLMSKQILYHAGIVSNIILVLASHIISLRYPLKIDYYRNANNRMFFANILPRTDPESLKGDLNSKLQSDKFFKDEITLSGLAMELGLKPYQLSHFINNYLEMSFSDLINSYRVEEAKKEILSRPETTILAIAYESGFNSKASFNRAFKKYTGLTPSDFRDRHK